eukprot:4574367-Prorocentrum_lima.AAC.1
MFFVDVSCAFTNASRLLLLGSESPHTEWEEQLVQLGYSPRSAGFIAAEVQQHGCLLHRAGVPPAL